jgi:hypothetical protein
MATTKYPLKPSPFHAFLIFTLLVLLGSSYAQASEKLFTYRYQDQDYLYHVKSTGTNYHFKFTNYFTDDEHQKLLAGYEILSRVYDDSTIEHQYSERYIKERARCFMYDSRFYTYTLCFLPNEFSQSSPKNLFSGFTTQVPNGTWLFTRFLLPVLIFLGCYGYIVARRLKNG